MWLQGFNLPHLAYVRSLALVRAVFDSILGAACIKPITATCQVEASERQRRFLRGTLV